MSRKTAAGKKIVANRRRAPKRAGERIRESARDLFYKRGIRAVGVDEIVTRAGVTKPSLYRSFSSKDALAADYLRHLGDEGLAHFDVVIAANPADPRGQFRIWLSALIQKTAKPDYRGCGATNAAVEYPDRKHPARKVAVGIKRRFRARLVALAKAMGADNPQALGDMLLLLLEGVYASCQLFDGDGPACVVVEAADALVESHLGRKR
ncbi:MAG TPA: helix-turn-helix domain-containing protein [Rhizomicrobium sp.]|jgi:AcrR family transcriptional regulator|nr:helix-turn-helix domain-containing protein [Rhizomicrobium sp.]